ncbi:MAG: protein kinase [Elusimicrobia bacterium]|nr:protein kinase [Elusimicrobiota bacterium]
MKYFGLGLLATLIFPAFDGPAAQERSRDRPDEIEGPKSATLAPIPEVGAGVPAVGQPVRPEIGLPALQKPPEQEEEGLGDASPAAAAKAPRGAAAPVSRVDLGVLQAPPSSGEEKDRPARTAPPGAPSVGAERSSGDAEQARGYSQEGAGSSRFRSHGEPEGRGEAKSQVEEMGRSAQSKLAARDYVGAAQDAARMIQLDRGNALARVFRSEAYNGLGRHREARQEALEAVAREPGNAAAWRNAAWAEDRLGRFDDALASSGKAIKAEPSNGVDYALRAYASEMLGEKTDAMKDMKIAAKYEPKFKGIYEQAVGTGKIFEPDKDDFWAIIETVAAAQREEKPSTGRWLALFGFLALGAGAGGVWLLRRRKGENPLWQADLADAMSPKTAAAPGEQKKIGGQYELGRLLGRGGMGEVFETKDHAHNRTVAVKRLSEEFIRLDPRARERMIQEQRAIAALRHPSIVEIYEVFEEDRDLFLVLEFVKGRSVERLLAEGRTLALGRALEILRPVCRALEYAHAQNLVHRNIKPSNILVPEQGDAKLMDFGAARSPAHSAPEVEAGMARKESDVYSIGACLYEMLTGRAPFAPPANRVQKIRMDFVPPSLRAPELPSEVDDVVSQALQPSPEARLKSVGEFLAKLEAAALQKSD